MGIPARILTVPLIVSAAYLWMIMPRMRRRPDRTPFTRFLYAHRGLYDNAAGIPENSLPAFRRAAEHGYGIELDVQLTADGVPVVFHDWIPDRMVRGLQESGKRISSYYYDELKTFRLLESEEHIPTLQEVLETVGGRVPLIVEYKADTSDVSVCAVSDALLREYAGIYCIESFNPLAVCWYRAHRPEILRGQLSDNFYREDPAQYGGISFFLLTNLMGNFVGRPDFIAYNHRYSGNLSLRLCKRLFHALSAAWTIRSEAELSQRSADYDLMIFESFFPEKEPERSAGRDAGCRDKK